jgi:hypothetical protein
MKLHIPLKYRMPFKRKSENRYVVAGILVQAVLVDNKLIICQECRSDTHFFCT